MTERRRAPAAAGFTLLSAVLLCSAIGLGIGFSIGAPAPLGIAGVFIGFAVGFRLVYARYRDL